MNSRPVPPKAGRQPSGPARELEGEGTGKVFHSVENFFPQCGKIGGGGGQIFHAMEKNIGIFPHNGKLYSTVWKNKGGN